MVSSDDAVAYVDLMDALQLLGVDTVDATRFVCAAVQSANPGTFWELYGRGGLTNAAPKIHRHECDWLEGFGFKDSAT